MLKNIDLKGNTIQYELNYKRVKNINLRIGGDGKISVSANRFVSQKVIEDFLLSKADFILKALAKPAVHAPLKQYFSETEIRAVISELCDKAYPYFKERGVSYPVIKFRKMVSQWGNCRSREGILTFNLNLMYAPLECVEYVVYHEFTHFLQANHSKLFYDELEKVCSDWKDRRKILKTIILK